MEDVNNDGNPELVFRMQNSPDELMYILGVLDNELICYDVFETHKSHLYFDLYDNELYYDYYYLDDESLYLVV